VNESNPLSLQIAFSPETFHLLLPTWIPGEIVEVDPKYPKGCFVRPLISLTYPHGGAIALLKCSDRKGMPLGTLVEFTHKPARSKQQPDLLQIDEFKPASSERIEQLKQEYARRVVSDIAAQALPDLSALDKKIEALNAEMDSHVRKALEVRISELNKQEREARVKTAQAEQALQELKQEEEALRQREIKLQQQIAKFEEVKGPALRLYESFTSRTNTPGRKISAQPRSKSLDYGVTLLEETKQSLLAQNFQVQDNILRQFLTATFVACTYGDLVLVTGPTGVGKTGLIEKVANVFGAGSSMVPVRPAWTDPGDLLGFYNPMQGLYQTTPFLESLLLAHDDVSAGRLFFICLDEMNLARIENYAADILSRLEKSKCGDAKLQLYSDDTREALDTEYQTLATYADKWGHEEAKKFQLLKAQLERIKPQLEIPDNLVLFGTLNIDETVPMPSPKTLDRSYVVQFSAVSLGDVSGWSKISPRAKSDLDTWLDWGAVKNLVEQELPPEVVSETEKLWQLIAGWEKPFLRPLGTMLGHRFATAYGRFMHLGHLLLGTDPNTLASDFIKMKLLPRVNFLTDEETSVQNGKAKKVEVWQKWCNDKAVSKFPELGSSLEEMAEANLARRVIQYWL
jgi:MoxR-like ATPase